MCDMLRNSTTVTADCIGGVFDVGAVQVQSGENSIVAERVREASQIAENAVKLFKQ